MQLFAHSALTEEDYGNGAASTRSVSAMHSTPWLGDDGHIAAMDDIEKRVIAYALQRYHRQISEVARRLKIGRSTLYRKMQQYGIEINS